MAFNGAFTIAESTTLGVMTLTDTSTGSDAELTGREIRIYKADGELFVAAIDWAIGDTSVNLAIMDKDYAFNIRVNWLSDSPLASPSTYEDEQIFAFTRFGEYEYGSITRLQTSEPQNMSDKSFFDAKNRFRSLLDSAKHAIDFMEDLYAAQRMIELYQYLITNKNLFY
jgi:hypothetical protein